MAAESRVHKFLTTHSGLISAIGMLLSAFGIILTIKSFYPARSKPTLIIDPVRVTIVDSRFFPNSFLKLTNFDNVLVQSDVIALRVYFWNGGTQPIKPEDVRQPLKISLNDISGKILDYRVLKISRPDRVKISLKPSKEDPMRELQVEFDTLEEDEGFTCQVIYAGNPASTLKLSGAILGVRRFDNNETVFSDRVWKATVFLVLGFLIISVMVVFMVWHAVTLALRFAIWRDTIINNWKQSAASRSNPFSYYVARLIPHMSVVALIVAIMLISFIALIVLTREYARVTIVESVPQDIRP